MSTRSSAPGRRCPGRGRAQGGRRRRRACRASPPPWRPVRRRSARPAPRRPAAAGQHEQPRRVAGVRASHRADAGPGQERPAERHDPDHEATRPVPARSASAPGPRWPARRRLRWSRRHRLLGGERRPRPRSGSASAPAPAPWRPAGRRRGRRPRRRRSGRRRRARRRPSPAPGWRPRRPAPRRGWPARTACPSSARSRRIVDQPLLGGVVQAAGRLVEQQQRRPRGEHDRQRQGEPLPLGQVARVSVQGHPGGQPSEQGRGWCRPGPSRPGRPAAHSRPTEEA